LGGGWGRRSGNFFAIFFFVIQKKLSLPLLLKTKENDPNNITKQY